MARQGWRRWAVSCLAAQGVAGLAAAGEPVKYSEEWWAMRGQEPPGARQLDHDGKFWPPFPRPVGEPQHWKHKFHHAHYWPYPYNCADDAYVRSVVEAQASNGWMAATTLQEYHFFEDTHQLNSAGRGQLYWILTQAPPQFRTVYVAQGQSPQVAQLRLENTQVAARELLPESSAPIVVRPGGILGRPAEEIDHLRRLELQSTPRPRLFIVGNTRGSGSGNSSSGSGLGSSAGGSGSGSSSSGGGNGTR